MTTTTYPEHVLEKYRHINVDHTDWDKDTIDEFKRDLTSRTHGLGSCLHITDVAWSGFWSQGDGASFAVVGCIEPKIGSTLDIDAVLQMFVEAGSNPFSQQDAQVIAAGFKTGLLTLDVTSDKYGRNHYCHENTVSHGITALYRIDPEVEHDEEYLKELALSERAALRLLQDHCVDRCYDGKWNNTAIDRLEAAFNEWARSEMRALYRALEKEYDYLTSDEAVAEAIEANDLYDPANDEED